MQTQTPRTPVHTNRNTHSNRHLDTQTHEHAHLIFTDIQTHPDRQTDRQARARQERAEGDTERNCESYGRLKVVKESPNYVRNGKGVE